MFSWEVHAKWLVLVCHVSLTLFHVSKHVYLKPILSQTIPDRTYLLSLHLECFLMAKTGVDPVCLNGQRVSLFFHSLNEAYGTFYSMV